MNMEGHNDLCVGIDLGTTNSVLATINVKPNGDAVSKVVELPRAVDIFNAANGTVKIAPQKKPTLPSCVYYREDKNYEPLVGDFAKMQYSLRPHLVAKSIKSQMGKPLAEGLTDGLPDKTPAEISARILQHMIKQAERIYQCKINDAVITVPANFDSAMCQATRDAAEKAGILVKNADGTERAVLLSEPNAVIYDLINQIHNGEIGNHIINLDKPQKVMVFDLGGGTLDITMHIVKRREDNPNILKVTEVATNRYTLLGGDNFDELLAREMYERYKHQYIKYPEVISKLQKNEHIIMAQLRTYAEGLKIDVSMQGNNEMDSDFDSGWGDEDEQQSYYVGGNMGGIGYAYDDNFTKEEIEAVFEHFMGRNFKFEDYKKIDTIKSTSNIIYPILDVLKKTADKLGDDEVAVDAIIVNGGMSKFYMVIDRLREFFGKEPIVALDPDQAVARGAAVYHYYLHNYAHMEDDMKLLGNVNSTAPLANKATAPAGNSASQSGFSPKAAAAAKFAAIKGSAIEFSDTILNDALYLGVRNSAVHTIVPTGASLPYNSEVMTGFQIMAGQNRINVPIKSRNLDNTYRTIANGCINFNKNYKENTYVALSVHMGSNKVISIKAWTSSKQDGSDEIEFGSVTLTIDNKENVQAGKVKFVPPNGSVLNITNELSNLRNLCNGFEQTRNTTVKKQKSQKLKASCETIANAANRADFAEPIMDCIEKERSQEMKTRLLVIARKMADLWTEKQQKRLANICINKLKSVIMGFGTGGSSNNTIIQSIYALGSYGSDDALKQLKEIQDNNHYYQACLYAFGKSQYNQEWLLKKCSEDCSKAKRYQYNYLPSTAYALGMSLRKGTGKVSGIDENSAVKILCDAITNGSLDIHGINNTVLALGWTCDQRYNDSIITEENIRLVQNVLGKINIWYDDAIVTGSNKVRTLAKKMIAGEVLSDEDERFLLTKLDI